MLCYACEQSPATEPTATGLLCKDCKLVFDALLFSRYAFDASPLAVLNFKEIVN